MMKESSPHEAARQLPPPPSPGHQRRGFLRRCLATVIGGFVGVFPAAAGLFAFADPLRSGRNRRPNAYRENSSPAPEGFVKVAAVEALPTDGTPQFFQVIDDRVDAWTYFPKGPIGAVFLRKEDDGSVAALNVTCPHAGCAVDYRPSQNKFFCPCHNSNFSVAGQRSEASPSARNLDALETLVQDDEVWVKYQNFRTGTAEKIPTA